MKKLLLFTAMLLVFSGCTRDETTDPGQPVSGSVDNAPHFYGSALLDTPDAATRGVANKLKLWPKSMAEEELTVKFLNGSEEYRAYVKQVAHEWEKAAGVRFIYVPDDMEAMIRIGFDYVRGMQTSWSYTGTDILQLFDRQDEPTIHFAQWRRISDEKKRSDVLRSFGQTLGLELEFRHPMLDPGWIRNDDGTLNEAEIRRYWEDELAEFISWDELKKMVLDPISVNARFIAQTDYYDPNSVMNWPFFEEIAHSQQPIDFDSDYKTELSQLDKEFIQSLYGESFNGMPVPGSYLPLIEFDFTGTSVRFDMIADKNLVVIWDEEAKACTYYDLPAHATSVSVSASHEFLVSKKRKIVIGEVLEYGQQMPSTSSALTKFDFTGAVGADGIVVKPYNTALETVWIRGGAGFIPQAFNFASNNHIKNLYLTQTLGSTVNVDNCRSLELLANTPGIYRQLIAKPFEPGDKIGIKEPGNALSKGWPYSPMDYSSLRDVNLQNCPNLKTVSFDNTQVLKLDFTERDSLEYVYLSSFDNAIVGGGNPKGQYLLETLRTLPSRVGKSEGEIYLRGIGYVTSIPVEQVSENQIVYPPARLMTKYVPVEIDRNTLKQIILSTSRKNWKIVWDSEVTLVN